MVYGGNRWYSFHLWVWTHFGINSSDLITVYAYDVARLAAWEQHIWAAHNVAPDGKVSNELLAAQVRAQPASTHAVEELLFKSMRMLEEGFRQEFNITLFTHDIDDAAVMQHVSRFASRDQASLLRLAKELVRVFSDRLDIRALRKLSTHAEKEKLGSNKLLQDVLAQKVGVDKARKIFGPIVGAYDMRVGDAHPTSSKIGDALKLAGIDESRSFLRQGEQLISNFGQSIWWIGKLLFGNLEDQKEHNHVYTDGRSQARIIFKAYTSTKVTDVLYKLLELPFAIIALLLDFDLNPRDCAGSIKSPDITTTYFLGPQNRILGWSKYRPKYLDEHLERLSKISIAEKTHRNYTRRESIFNWLLQKGSAGEVGILKDRMIGFKDPKARN